MKLLRSHPVLLAATLLLGLAMVYYYHGILVPVRQDQFRLANAAQGNWSDLYAYWMGACEVLLHGRNPYSPEVTRENQRGFYGRPLDPSNPKDPVDQEAFVYPVYVVFLLAPSLGFSFATARVLFAGALLLLTAGSVLLWLRALRLHLPRNAIVIAVLITMSSYPVLDGIHLQQVTLLVAALMAASLAALAAGHLFLGGMLLACATVKPQLIFLLAAGLAVWSAGDWRSRKVFWAGFGAALAVLLGAAELVLPGWFGLWRQAAQTYVAYVRPSLLATLLGAKAGMLAGAVLAAGAVFIFWRSRHHASGSQQFDCAVVAALLVTTLLTPNAGNAKYNLVLLIPACLWLVASAHLLRLRTASGLAHMAWLLAFHSLLWQWVLAFAASFAVLVLRRPVQHEATLLLAAPEILVFFFPLALAPLLASAVTHLELPDAP